MAAMKVCTLLFLYMAFVGSQEFEPKDYCLFGEPCWPSDDVFKQLGEVNPSLEIVRRGDGGWNIANNLVLNARVAKTPGAVIYASTVRDVIAVVNFTQTYNLDLKIISSGHEFIGRNIAEGCILLSVLKIDNVFVDLNCAESSTGCMTVGPGVLWLTAYREADMVNRTVLGGAEPSVSVTGWALGGGHSPYSPKIGLGVDHMLEVDMVLADLSLVTLNKNGLTKKNLDGTVTESNETDLFWAIRGGGGGTFGVVTSITYRLHLPPSNFTIMHCELSAIENPEESMKKITKSLRPVMANLPDEFGGYLYTGALCYVQPCQMAVYASYIFMHYGARSENAEAFDELERTMDSLKQYQLSRPCVIREFDTFYDYIEIIHNVTHQNVDFQASFLSPSEYSDKYLDKEAELIAEAFHTNATVGVNYIRLGGQTKNDSSGATAVNPLFRNAMWTLTYGKTVGTFDQRWKEFEAVLDEIVTEKGQYYSECDDDLPDGEWQKQFWGQTTYNSLLEIKRKYDPTNHFTCRLCVGSGGGTLADGSTSTVANSAGTTTPGVFAFFTLLLGLMCM